MKINLSFIPELLDKLAWIFGDQNAINHVKYIENWWPYKPTDESQRFAKFDPWDCTNRSEANALETLFNYKTKNGLFGKKALDFLNGKNCLKASYFDKNGSINFLDKFNSILSGTKAYVGNTAKASADSIVNYGMVPENIFDWGDDPENNVSAVDYYSRDSIERMVELGEEFKEMFKINFETITSQKDFVNAIWYSPIACGVAAWYYDNKTGYYYKGGSYNHFTTIMNIDSHYEIFDSYNPFIKNLTPYYDFMDLAYTWYVEERENYMKLKPGNRYVGLCGNHKEYGFAKLDKRDNLTKLIVGDRDEMLNLFIDENGGNIAGKVTTILEKDWNSITHYNTKLEMTNI